MARQLLVDMPLDEIEDEILFTRSAIKADPDANDCLATTDGWLAQIDAARAKDRVAREAAGEAGALRMVANGRLDDACRRFGDRLLLDVGKDAAAGRFRRFFKTTIGAFIKQRLADQVVKVRDGWLVVQGDTVLDAHREDLDRWSLASRDALTKTAASAQARGDAHVAREELSEDLTRERDGLEALLVARAKERGLSREWPSRFFRKGHRGKKNDDDVETDAVTLPVG